MTITLFNTLLFWVDVHYVLGFKIYTRCSDITHSTNTLSVLYVLNTTLINFDNWTKDRSRIIFKKMLILIYNLVQSSHKKLYTNKIPKVILHTLLINIASRVDLNARSITPEQKNKRQAQKNKRSPPIIKTLHLFLPFDFEYSIYTLSHTSKFGCIRIHTNRLKTV